MDKIADNFQNELAFIVICMGLVFSIAWWLVNLGSKKWQENWEKHIDMLEDHVTGPLYKTIWNKTAYSVSRINIDVSAFVTCIWFLLAFAQAIGVPYTDNHPLFKGDIDWVVVISALATSGFIIYLFLSSRRVYKRTEKDAEGFFSFERRSKHFHGPLSEGIVQQ